MEHADADQNQHDIRNLPVCALHRDDVPHRAEHRAVCAARHARDGYDLLAACELADPIAVPIFAVQGTFKIGLLWFWSGAKPEEVDKMLPERETAMTSMRSLSGKFSV